MGLVFAIVGGMSIAEDGENDTGTRLLTVVPDANVLIHGKSLTELPWAELGRPTIEVLLVPPTIREIDKLKAQTGRPNRIARQLSSDVRALIGAPGGQAQIRNSGPAVSKRVELRPAATEFFHQALRLDHADQALINYCLQLQQAGLDVLLLTDDTICGATASEVGLPIRYLPDSWRREPEPDESEREITRLKAELQRLSAAEPKIKLGFRDEAGLSLSGFEVSLTRWRALTEAELDQLMGDVRRQCPQATSFERQAPFPPGMPRAPLSPFTSHYEPATEAEIEQYKTSGYPNWLESVREALQSLHETLSARTQWPTVVVVASNTGTRPATETLVRIQAQGGFLILNDGSDEDDDANRQGEKASDRVALPLPPRPPRGRTKTVDLFGAYRGLHPETLAMARPVPPLPLLDLTLSKQRESDAFYWRTGRRGWVSVMELECHSWRHGREDLNLVLSLRPPELVETAGALELSVHAHNISDPIIARLPIRIAVEEGSTIEEARAFVEALGRAARAQGRL